MLVVVLAVGAFGTANAGLTSNRLPHEHDTEIPRSYLDGIRGMEIRVLAATGSSGPIQVESEPVGRLGPYLHSL